MLVMVDILILLPECQLVSCGGNRVTAQTVLKFYLCVLSDVWANGGVLKDMKLKTYNNDKGDALQLELLDHLTPLQPFILLGDSNNPLCLLFGTGHV